MNNSISLLLIVDSVSLSCTSGSKEFKISRYKYLHIFFLFRNVSRFFVSLYKELLEATFSACLIVLDNLYEIFPCSIITDFISTVSKVFG